eukprot:CAMPEP_0171075062 /NCGR_PEP_ID=MMETSP0766_2-20121228/12546_1 /TAXON_ID=439317 /ORGANISM="Gambierdiscus australes, Strain CAWD 149" /LENGTH=61 /DNA_ID=CAMNT_0011531897 /DNA_START=188 /DNA_END=371 /DNA_ORIENTATION=+
MANSRTSTMLVGQAELLSGARLSAESSSEASSSARVTFSAWVRASSSSCGWTPTIGAAAVA